VDNEVKNGYMELFVAIWKLAVQDDIKKAKNQLTFQAFTKAYEEYSLNTVDPMPIKSPKMKKIKKAIHDLSTKLCERLERRIKELVYEEAQRWPGNRWIKDKKYDRIMGELKKEALAFARKKMMELAEEGKCYLKYCCE